MKFLKMNLVPTWTNVLTFKMYLRVSRSRDVPSIDYLGVYCIIFHSLNLYILLFFFGVGGSIDDALETQQFIR